jgi:DNA-binding winged helix-turn-helix (wHTH) protein
MPFVFGAFELDEERRELRKDGVTVPAQPKTLDLLLYLVRNRDRAVMKRELFDAVWPGVTVTEAAMWRAIMRARTAVEDEAQQKLVTVRGRGFRFAADVVERASSLAERVSAGRVDRSFVGRTSSLSAAEARLDEALAGHGSAVWITGVAGIGKTRLAAEVARRARVRGARVYEARPLRGAKGPASGLWSEVVRAIAPASSDVREALSRDPVVPAGSSPAPEPAAWAAFARQLVDLSRETPTVLILDDLQWADEHSALLLRRVVRELAAGAVLLVGALRDAPAAVDATMDLLGECMREHTSYAVPLRGLAKEEVARLVEVTTGLLPSNALAQELFERSGGNPFYVRRLVASEPVEQALHDADGSLATTLELEQDMSDSIGAHIESLTPSTSQMLLLAAILGREFDVARLVAVSGEDRGEVLAALDEGKRAGLVASLGPSSFRFAPPLVRDALYTRLTSGRRAELHRMVANRLVEHYGDSVDLHAGELARHLTRALPGADAIRAVDLAVLAASQQGARGAHRRAAKLWRLAAEALTYVPAERTRLVDVHLGLADACVAAGDSPAAREAFLDALTIARTIAAGSRFATAALGFAELAVSSADLAVASRCLEEARRLVSSARDAEEASLRAAVEARLRALQTV